jgi:hypothetical protein
LKFFNKKYFFLLLLFIISFCSVFSQINTSLDVLEASLFNYYNSIKDADIEEHRKINRLNWLNFIPSLGYDFISHSYVVSYSFSQIANFIQSQEKKKNKIISIEKHNCIDFDNAILQLHSSYNHINNLIEKLKYDRLIFEKQKELFSIYEKQYQNNEINHEQYLKYSISLMQQQSIINSKENSIIEIILKLEHLVNHKISYTID